MNARPLFFPPIDLYKSDKTQTSKFLYSGDASRQLGAKEARQSLYIGSVPEFRDGAPEQIKMRLYSQDPGKLDGPYLVRQLVLEEDKPAESAFRYFDVTGDLGTVYFHKNYFQRSAPLSEVWILLEWQ